MFKKLISLSCFLCCFAPALAQTKSYPCQPEASVQTALSKLPTKQDATLNFEQRADPIRSLLKQNPGDLFVHQRYQDAFSSFWLGGLAAAAHDQYRALLSQNPDDPFYLYLYGRMLILLRRKAAEEYLLRAAQLAPNFAWPHLALVELYQFPGVRDSQKAQEHLQSFISLCPSCLEAYRYFAKIEDQEFLARGAQRLRTMLTAQPPSQTLPFYRSLWDLESRVRPKGELQEVRNQVKQDLANLRERNLWGNLDWYQALLYGYKLLNDAAGTVWTEDQVLKNVPDSALGISTLKSRWHKEHPMPGAQDSLQTRNDFQKAWYEAAKGWTRRWPTAMSAWEELHLCLGVSTDVPAEEMTDAEEGFLRVSEQNQDLAYFVPPFSIVFAEILLRHNVHLDQIPAMVQRGIHTIEMQEGLRTQFDVYDRDFKEFAQNVVNTRSRGRQILFDLALKSNQLQEARSILVLVEADIDKNLLPPEDASQEAKDAYKYRRVPFWTMAAQLAEAENRKIDAVAFYQKICLLYPKSSLQGGNVPALASARRLWQDLGGTGEGWQILLAPTDAESNVVRDMPRTTVSKSIADFSLSDLKGRKWKMADLKGGKVTLINFWATWCGPCRAELPEIQKLHERLKGRQDLQVLTFNMDENQAVVAPFVERSGFTFPVIPARLWAERFNPIDYLPQSWIVLPDGTFSTVSERTADSLLGRLEEILRTARIGK